MGLLHMGQTQRTSSHFTRHLWAKEDLRYPKLLCCLSSTDSFLDPNHPYPCPSLRLQAAAVQTGCRALLTSGRWEEVGTEVPEDASCLFFFKRPPWTHIPTVDTYFRWKACWHGSTPNSSFPLKSSRQTAQVCCGEKGGSVRGDGAGTPRPS